MGKGSKDGDAPQTFCPADYTVGSKTAADFGCNVILLDIYKAVLKRLERELMQDYLVVAAKDRVFCLGVL